MAAVNDLASNRQSPCPHDSPNIAGLVQEIVDRPGWRSSNPLVVVYWTTSYSGSDRKIWAYDGNAGHAAKLVIA